MAEQELKTEETQEQEPAEESKLLVVFKGTDMTLKSFYPVNVTVDQLLYFAAWLDEYARTMMQDARLKAAMAQVATLESEGLQPRIARPGEHGTLVSDHGILRS